MRRQSTRERQATTTPRHPFTDTNGWCRDVADPFLERHGPPVRTTMPFGPEGWMVTRFHDVRKVLSDRRISSVAAARHEVTRLTAAGSTARSALVARSDPPTHTRLRKLYNGALSAAGAAPLRPRLERHVNDHMDRIVAVGPPADLVGQLFIPVLTHFIGDVMGVPEPDRARLRGMLLKFQSTTMPTTAMHETNNTACAYFDDLVRERSHHLGDDAISAALCVHATQDNPGTLPDIASMAAGVYGTAIDAPGSVLGPGTHALLSHRDEWVKLRAHPERMDDAVREIIRYTPFAVGGLRARRVVEDFEVGGVLLRAGDAVIPHAGAAGFDPEVVPHPFRLDLFRAPVPSMIFGFGPHFCQGFAPAEMVMGALIAALVERLPKSLRVAVPNERLRFHKTRNRHLKELPVTW